MAAIARSEPFREASCPLGVCDGSGWILGPEDVARPCECREQRLRKARGRGIASAIPPRYRGVSFERPPLTEMARDAAARHAVAAARGFVGSIEENLAAGRGLWFMGNTGTGKTTLGMLVAKAAMSAGHSAAIYFAPALLTRIRQTYAAVDAADSYESFFQRLTSVDLLYIDDLGSERHTDWVVEQLYALVNERYESQRSVLVTSNAPRDIEGGIAELEEQIGVRTVSRLVEICGDPLPLFGPDRRIEAPAPADPAAERGATSLR